MARDAMKDEPLAPTMNVAGTFQFLFLAALVWNLASEPLYLTSAGLSLQFLTELVAALPFGLSEIWLAGAWRGRGLRPPIDPLVFAVDLVACVSIAIVLGAGAWIWIGGRFDRIDALGGMPLLLFIAYVAVAPALSGLVWLILRTAGGDAQRLGLRNAAQAAAKRSAHL
jgi:hypothetical protein